MLPLLLDGVLALAAVLFWPGADDAWYWDAASRAPMLTFVVLAVHVSTLFACTHSLCAANTAVEKLLSNCRNTLSMGNLVVDRWHGLEKFSGLGSTCISGIQACAHLFACKHAMPKILCCTRHSKQQP